MTPMKNWLKVNKSWHQLDIGDWRGQSGNVEEVIDGINALNHDKTDGRERLFSNHLAF